MFSRFNPEKAKGDMSILQEQFNTIRETSKYKAILTGSCYSNNRQDYFTNENKKCYNNICGIEVKQKKKTDKQYLIDLLFEFKGQYKITAHRKVVECRGVDYDFENDVKLLSKQVLKVLLQNHVKVKECSNQKIIIFYNGKYFTVDFLE